MLQQRAPTPYPSPAFRTIWLGDFSPQARAARLDPDKIYISPSAILEASSLAPLRARGVQYVVLQRSDTFDRARDELLAVLDRESVRLADFSPFHDAAARGTVAPFFHNTDARIDVALERPGPPISVYRITE